MKGPVRSLAPPDVQRHRERNDSAAHKQEEHKMKRLFVAISALIALAGSVTAYADITFPVTARGAKVFEDGGGADWVVEVTLSNSGRMDMASNIKAHRSLNGWCGRFAVLLFDKDGNVFGQFGMSDGISWCVNGRLSPAGGSERNDRMTQDVPASVLGAMHSIAVDQVTAPTPHTVISVDEAKKLATAIAGAASGAHSEGAGLTQIRDPSRLGAKVWARASR
jgi:hypothetical protein